jgi:ADP-dependent NAD(P)H-hydrate dehydratase
MNEPTTITGGALRDWPLPTPSSDDGKEARGSIVVIGGARSTPGAVLLAGLAALRVGAGKLTIATVESTAGPLGVAVPEAAVIGLPETVEGYLGAGAADQAAELLADADAIVIGPGMSGPEQARGFVERLMAGAPEGVAVVLDALGLTCGAMESTAAARLAAGMVITPNPAEASWLLGQQVDDTAIAAQRLAKRFRVVVALRSTVVSPAGPSWFDGGGNSGLGTSGSGDVLAGAIGGLMARGASADQAAVWGVHVHAESGERLAARVGGIGYLAREILEELPRVLAQLNT